MGATHPKYSSRTIAFTLCSPSVLQKFHEPSNWELTPSFKAGASVESLSFKVPWSGQAHLGVEQTCDFEEYKQNSHFGKKTQNSMTKTAKSAIM